MHFLRISGTGNRTRIRCRYFRRQHFYIGLAPFFDLGLITQPYKLDSQVVKTAYAADKDPLKKELSEYFVLDAEGNIDQSKVYLPHMAAGVGLKVAMNENFVLSVDWAMSLNEQDNAKWANFYIKMGYLF